jgi:mannitol/fructose-specific phosphotransferase system IIA component (Ntr-type)
MQVNNYIKLDAIEVQVEIDSKQELLEYIINKVSNSETIKSLDSINEEEISKGVLERESQCSTGLGDGYAFPHARLKGLEDIVTYLIILKNEIDYQALDGKPVKVICLILAPEENPTLALKFISELVKTLSEKEIQEKIISATSNKEIFDIFSENDTQVELIIRASDIMRKPFTEVTPETPLKKLTRVMSEFRINAVAVTENKKVVGQVTCDDLFNYGVPDFFKSLKSVAFIDEFNPFDKYFAEEANSKAEDVMTHNYVTMPETATLLEIVFALTVQKHPKVYVVNDNNELQGIIDQSTVLDRIVNF